MYERLTTLLQNLQVSRNIDTENLAILEKARPVTRSYALEKHLLVVGGFSGLVLGLGIIVLLGRYRASRYNLVPPTPAL